MNEEWVERFHRDALFRRLLEFEPATVLDVGCGTGDLLLRCQEQGIRAAGVEPDPELVAQARARGLDVQAASAEELPFPDDSFDLIASEFCIHHYRDVPRFFAEAIRVARKGIVTLDVWYDPGIPAHRVAAALDTWSKRIDRDQGEVHNDVATADTLVAALPAGWQGSYQVRGQLTDVLVAEDQWQAQIEEQLARSCYPERDANEADSLRDQARQHGVAAEGGLIFVVALAAE